MSGKFSQFLGYFKSLAQSKGIENSSINLIEVIISTFREFVSHLFSVNEPYISHRKNPTIIMKYHFKSSGINICHIAGKEISMPAHVKYKFSRKNGIR